MSVKKTWVTLTLLLTMLILDLILLCVFLALIGLSYVKARAGELDYYIYLSAGTVFIFVYAFFLTLTGIVFVIHERLVKAPKDQMLEDIELKDLNPHLYLSIDFIPEKDTLVATEATSGNDAPSATPDTGQVTHANFLLHEKPYLTGDQTEEVPVFKLTGEASRLTKTRFTVKNSPDVNISYKPFVFKQFVPLSFLSCLAIYVFCTLFLLGMCSFSWAIVIAQYYRSLSYKIGWTFAVVDFTSGILAPLLLLSSITLASFVLSYFTRREISIRSAITPLLDSVSLFQHSDGSEYWLVGKRFKYELTNGKTRRSMAEKHPWIETHYSTWAFWIVICISFLFSFSQFINQTVIAEQTSSTCITDYDCFLAVHPFSFEHIICPAGANGTFDITFMRNNSIARLPNNTVLYCFQYLDFGVDNNLFLSLGTTYALYLFGIALFYRIFNLFSVFIQLKQTRIWSLILILVGVLCIVAVILIYFLNGLHAFLFNIIRFFEILQFSAYFFVIGVLVLVYFHQDGIGVKSKEHH